MFCDIILGLSPTCVCETKMSMMINSDHDENIYFCLALRHVKKRHNVFISINLGCIDKRRRRVGRGKKSRRRLYESRFYENAK